MILKQSKTKQFIKKYHTDKHKLVCHIALMYRDNRRYKGCMVNFRQETTVCVLILTGFIFEKN